MSGVKTFVLAVSLVAVLSACESFVTLPETSAPAVPPQEASVSIVPPREASDYWECVDRGYGSQSQTVVRAWVLADPEVYNQNGVVEANGIRKDAWYRQEGLSHRWNFDLDQDKGAYAASFVIELDGDGKYYLFGGEETAKPSTITKCTKLR